MSRYGVVQTEITCSRDHREVMKYGLFDVMTRCLTENNRQESGASYDWSEGDSRCSKYCAA